MNRLPPKRTRPRSGIVRGPRRDFPTHEAFVRRHQCAMPCCPYTDDPVECAHIGPTGTAGEGIKAASWWTTSWCRTHHRLAHLRGHETACREAGTTLDAQRQIAIAYAKNTTDKAMRQEMKVWRVNLETGEMASPEEVLFA